MSVAWTGCRPLLTRSFLSIVTRPEVEPVTLAEARLHLRVDEPADDQQIQLAIQAARELVEHDTGRALLEQDWKQIQDGFPVDGEPIEIQKAPVVAAGLVVTYYDAAGALQTWDSSNYIVARPEGPTAQRTRIAPVSGVVYPVTQARPDAVTVAFTCGEPDLETVPAALKIALLTALQPMYDRRPMTEDERRAYLYYLGPHELVTLV